MSEEKPKAGGGTPSPAPGGPPKLERVPAGYKPSPTVRAAEPAAPKPAPPGPAAPAKGAPPPAAKSAPPPAATVAPGASYGLAAREVGADAAIAAGIAHEGKLASDGPLRLFALAAALQATGRLELSPEGKSYALSFRRGTVEHASSTDAGDDLGRFLVQRGAITEAQRQQAQAAAGTGGGLAAALIAEKLVNPADVAGLLQEHGAGIVQRALAVTAGKWAWTPAGPPPPGAFPLGPPFAMLCAAVRALDAKAVLDRLGDREHRAASRVGGRLRVEDLRLTAQEARAAGFFDGVRSPAELAAASPGDALAILRAALLLGEVDLLAFGASTKGATPPARPAGAPAPPPAAAAQPPRPAAAPSPQPPRPPAAPAAKPAVPGAEKPAGPAGARPAAPPRPAPPPQKPAPAAAARPPVETPRPAPPSALERSALEALVKKLATADNFEVLGVPRTATGAQIKIAYFQLAKTYHPDAVPADAAADVRKLCADAFSRIGEAWSVLGSDASRLEYLEALKSGGTQAVDVASIFQAESLFEEGTLLTKARKYEDAIRKFDEAMKLNADEAEFGIWKTFCEFLLSTDKRARHARSAAAIEEALKKNPRCVQGYLFLGQMAKIVGDLALAERQLKRGLGVAPDQADLQRELKYLRK